MIYNSAVCAWVCEWVGVCHEALTNPIAVFFKFPLQVHVVTPGTRPTSFQGHCGVCNCVCMCVGMCVCVYVCERERERERD